MHTILGSTKSSVRLNLIIRGRTASRYIRAGDTVVWHRLGVYYIFTTHTIFLLSVVYNFYNQFNDKRILMNHSYCLVETY